MANETSKSLVLVSKQNGIVVIPAETPLTRLNYFDGKFLRASDLKAEQDYLRHLVRQSNQAGGSGVAHGFDVRLGGGDTIEMGPGLAIDPEGRVLLLPQGAAFSVQELIDKSLDLQSVYGKSEVKLNDSFEICEQTTATPPDSITHPNNLYVIVISAAEALCGEEDVYGKLCEEACSTSTDRPLAVEGLIVRAVPLVLQTPLPNPKAVSITTQTHYRSRVAAAYFEDERNRLAHLISAQGLKQQTWCLGADAAGNGGVAIGVFARAGSTTIFLDPWIVRRELIDTPARRYWQWRMMMRPWDVFLAQVLQFQCQLHELYQKFPDPGVGVDPCGGARDALKEAAATIAELKQFYEKTSQQFTYLNFEMEKAITLPGGWGALDSLKTKLENVGQGLSILPPDQWLINGGIVELPSAGYLPVVPDGSVTVNDQVRRMMGKGVDLRFCVVRPDFVAHALEEAQHMERISLTAGLEDEKQKPEVDILVPDGEIVAPTVEPSTLRGFDVKGEFRSEMQSFGEPSGHMITKLDVVSVEGAARYETVASGGSAFYLSCASQQLYVPALRAGVTKNNWLNESKLKVPVIGGDPPIGLWLSLKADADLRQAKVNDVINVSGEAFVAGRNANGQNILQFSGALGGKLIINSVGADISGEDPLTCSLSMPEPGIQQQSTNDYLHKTQVQGDWLDFAVTTKPGNFIIELNLQEWTKLNIAVNFSQGTALNLTTVLHQTLTENLGVFSQSNANHIRALDALKAISNAKDEPGFATEKEKLLFPPEPPKKSGEAGVKAKRDWVLFHRRRTKNCEETAVATRRYRVYQAKPPDYSYDYYDYYGGPSDRVPRQPLTTNDILEVSSRLPEMLNLIGYATFGGAVATLVGDTSSLKNAWKKIPGAPIVWGAIGSKGDAVTDGEPLALNRLTTLASELDQISPQARKDVLPIIPPSLDSPDIDGVILLVNDRLLYSYYYGYSSFTRGIGGHIV